VTGNTIECLKSALASRYTIERELGADDWRPFETALKIS